MNSNELFQQFQKALTPTRETMNSNELFQQIQEALTALGCITVEMTTHYDQGFPVYEMGNPSAIYHARPEIRLTIQCRLDPDPLNSVDTTKAIKELKEWTSGEGQ